MTDTYRQARTLANSIIASFTKGDITYAQGVTVCSQCVDCTVGEKAFRMFKKEIRRVRKTK